MSELMVQTLWVTAKAQLATITADAATLQTDLQTMENLRAQLAAAGGGDVAEWLRIQIVNLGLGYRPLVQGPGGVPAQPSARISLFGPEPTLPRDLSQLGDQRPISAIHPGLS